MGRLDNAKTYDCPLRFTITKCEYGWTYMSCDFYGTKLNFTISDLDYQPSALLQSAYTFNTYEDNFDGIYSIEIERADNVPDSEGNCWDHVVVRTFFRWEEEPESAEWTISLNPDGYGSENYPLEIKIERWDFGSTKEYKFNVMYRDFCYAVAKCFTDALKTYGFLGYHWGTYEDDIVIRELLIIKAYALGILSNLTSIDATPEYGYDFTFEEELQLLAMDM